jgi:DNA processing protein
MNVAAETAPLGMAITLASLPGVGPRRLRLLCGSDSVPDAFARLAAGELPPSLLDTGREWPAALRAVDVEAVGHAARRLGIGHVDFCSPNFPTRLRADPEAPAVLFYRGRIEVQEGPTVAIVGTRKATPYGRRVAAAFARELAHQGVSVVSGLAVGIDGAAHDAAVSSARLGARGAPVGVVGSGLDVIYPRQHASLWEAVSELGVLLSEAPPGARPEPWRFPLRNRILAALADVVVVVESATHGGSLHTVEAALVRDKTVLAVPGPVTSPVSQGCNALVGAGAVVASSTDDILTALGFVTERVGERDEHAVLSGADDGSDRARGRSDPLLSEGAEKVLAAVQVEPLLADELVLSLGMPLLDVVRSLGELEALGLTTREGARWLAGRVA